MFVAGFGNVLTDIGIIIIALLNLTDCDVVTNPPRAIYQKDSPNEIPEPELLPVLHGNDTRCRISEYLCANKKCIPINRFCDGTNDCGDSSDEPRHCTREYILYYIHSFDVVKNAKWNVFDWDGLEFHNYLLDRVFRVEFIRGSYSSFICKLLKCCYIFRLSNFKIMWKFRSYYFFLSDGTSALFRDKKCYYRLYSISVQNFIHINSAVLPWLSNNTQRSKISLLQCY